MKTCIQEFYQSVLWKTTLLSEWRKKDGAAGEVEIWCSCNKASANPTGSLNVDGSSDGSSNWGKGARTGYPSSASYWMWATPVEKKNKKTHIILGKAAPLAKGSSWRWTQLRAVNNNTLITGRVSVGGTPQSPIPWVTPQFTRWELNSASSYLTS